MLDVRHLSVTFDSARGPVPAVRDVSFTLAPGEILGLVGESGSGKSATALALPRILDRTARVSGQVLFEGRDLLTLSEREMQRVRGAAIAMIFQEPMTALNPVMTIGNQIAEAVREGDGRAVALDMLRQVGMSEPERRIKQYPHHLSGGMRQRAMIAMALAGRPKVLVADEPTTALDVTVQAQILALLKQLRERFGLAILLITHDLGVVAETADRVAVMYAGSIVESGPLRDVFNAPAHPYTRGLLRVAPQLDCSAAADAPPADAARHSRRLPPAADARPSARVPPADAAPRFARLPIIPGSAPNPTSLPPGCSFEPRCDARIDPCTAGVPELAHIAAARDARCIRATEVAAGRA